MITHKTRPQRSGPPSFGLHHGLSGFVLNSGLDGGFGPTHGNRSSTPPMATELVSNNLQIDPSITFRPHGQPSGGVAVSRCTKPWARVFIGLPRLGDIHASDYSDPSISTTHHHETSGDGTDSPVPGPVGTTSWYPESGASNHVYQDSSALRDVVPYSGQHNTANSADGAYS